MAGYTQTRPRVCIPSFNFPSTLYASMPNPRPRVPDSHVHGIVCANRAWLYNARSTNQVMPESASASRCWSSKACMPGTKARTMSLMLTVLWRPSAWWWRFCSMSSWQAYWVMSGFIVKKPCVAMRTKESSKSPSAARRSSNTMTPASSSK